MASTWSSSEITSTVNFPFENSSDYTERPAVTYSAAVGVYLAAWNNRDNGSAYTQRYSPTTPITGTASFTAAPSSGVVPLTVTFTDTSSGTIASRTWNFGDGTLPITVTSSTPLTHTYLTTGTFTSLLTVTNPGGSSSASQLITVTEQITPALSADFESLNLGIDPDFWVDQLSDTTSRDDFETLWAGPSAGSGQDRALGTVYSSTNTVYSHYAIPGWASWQNYDYRGRLKMSEAQGGIGLAFNSRYPAGQQLVYVLRRYAGTPDTESFHLVAFGTSLLGDTQLDLTPQANVWYRFWAQVVTLANRVTLRVKVWPEGQSEPALWQAEAYDDSPSRSPAGAVGVRSYGPGAKYFDELVVTPLALQADFSASPRSGLAPLNTSFTATPLGQVLTYTWNFGDGSALVSSILTASHTYPEAGVYTASLTVQGPSGSDTLTRPTYIQATNLTTDLRGHWSLNEAGGLRLDSSAYGNHLTETNTVSYTVGQVGQAADFERSSSEYLSISHTLQSGLVITGSLTLAGWVKLESLNPSAQMIVASKYEYGVNNRAYRLDVRTDGKPGLIVSPDGSYDPNLHELVGPTPLLTNTWSHLAAVVDPQAQMLSLYVDGTLAATRAISFNTIYPSTAPFMLGANLNNGSPAQYYDGLLDEWRVYARALNQAEVQNLMVTTPPTVTFSAAPLTSVVPLTVTFTNSSTNASSYLWHFGNSFTSTLINPTHSYNQAGVFTVTLTATGAGGSTTLTKTNYITVTLTFTQNWRRITTTVSPPITGEHSLAYDSARNRVVLYGGNGTGWPYAGSTWEFDGSNWITITTTATPTARYGAAMAYDSIRGVTILFGGSEATDTALNQTWRYTNTTWNPVTITGTVPASRTYASLVAGPSGQLYLFGGNNSSPQLYYNDLWRYDNGNWSQIPITSTIPSARTLAAMSYDPANNRLLLFGGRTVTGTLLADLWAFDLGGSTWSQINPPASPPPRMAHTLTYNSAINSVILVGGATNNGDTLLNDTWHYSQNSWTQVNPTTTLPARAYHQVVYGNNAIILFSNGEVWKYE